jgi:maltose alpha-D-glucosyltransferase / alpha-amylase
MQEQWYHNAIIYSLDVETYKDSNGDGIGDFSGLIEKLDHLAGLGVNCLWLRPFYPSPLADDGYDVMNYYNVDPRLGNLGDFAEFMVKARAFGMKVIVDLVVNHTSNQHEWFRQARESKTSKFRDFYIWKDKPTEEDQRPNMIGDGGIWEYDRKAKSYYLHHFLKEQPDLNVSNPEVMREIKKIMGFWLQLGVSGFRIDAAHIIVLDSKDRAFELLEEMRLLVTSRNPEAILIGEANVEINGLQEFFSHNGVPNRLHKLFNFISNKNLFLAMARESAKPLTDSLPDTWKIKGSWVNFIRTHDELNLEMITDEERDEVFKVFAPAKNMQLFGHGIRRRLPPMLNGERKRMELIYCIMFSLPGLPLINYGEEIAMGDDLSQKGRESVRTVMQWDDLKNAGFSKTQQKNLIHSVVDSGEYDYSKVNVRLQLKDPDSFLNWMERLISTRKHNPILSYGSADLLKNNQDSVFSFFTRWENETIILLHNLKNKKVKVKVNTSGHTFENVSEILCNQSYEEVSDLTKEIEISEYGYRWFKSEYASSKK